MGSHLDDLHTIMKAVSAGKDTVSKYQRKSIARGGLDGTLQFPLIISDGTPIDEASVLGRFFERTYAAFVQQYLSMNSTVNIGIDRNPEMYLKRFHQNVKLEKTAEDFYKEYCIGAEPGVEEVYESYDKLMERVYDGSTVCYVNESCDKALVFNFSENFSREIYESNKEDLEEALACIDMRPFPNVGNSPFYEAPPLAPLSDENINGYMAQKAIDAKFARDAESRRAANDMNKETHKAIIAYQGKVPVLTDADVKKSNDMQPYTMQVRLMAVNDENEFVQFMDFLVGIKVVLHLVKSEEMIVNIAGAIQNNNKIFNFIRWTTGEKKLFKDLLLHINEVKLDVANNSRGASKWWPTLKRLKQTANAQKAFFSRTSMLPNATLAITSYELDVLSKQYGCNMRDVRIAKALMDGLFLMNFVIIDEGTRTIEVLYDQETSFQTYALESLEREVSLSSNRIGKEIGRMISR